MRLAIFPGSFDPLTNGHLDIITRSAPIFDVIVIAVLKNVDKHPMFTVEERCEMIREVIPTIKTNGCELKVEGFSGLTADFAHEKNAVAIIRGIRAVGDYARFQHRLRDSDKSRKRQCRS